MELNQKDIESKIVTRQESEEYEYFKYGVDYYKGRNTNIMERDKKVYMDGFGVVSNPFAANHKMANGHFRLIVDQKVRYLLENGIIFEAKQTEDLDKYFKDGLNEFIGDMATEASKKAEAWAYFYKDADGLKVKLIPAEQITPVYDEEDEDKLIAIIRDYETDSKKVRLIYDSEKVQRYEKKNDNKNYKLVREIGHYTRYNQFNGRPIGEPEPMSFTQIPFIPLYNNKTGTSDLYAIKPLLDVYDIILSDFANNIDDMQDAFFTLKGYSGDSKDLAEFMRQLKSLKAIPVGDDGSVGVHQLEVPTTARQTMLDILRKEIYKAAMAVDLDGLSGGSLTNTHINGMFVNLELKVSQFEDEIRKFIYKMIDFINANDGKNFDYDFKFETSKIFNRKEEVETILKAAGYYTDETIRELLPFDVDLAKEKERIEEQKEAYPIQLQPVEPDEDSDNTDDEVIEDENQ